MEWEVKALSGIGARSQIWQWIDHNGVPRYRPCVRFEDYVVSKKNIYHIDIWMRFLNVVHQNINTSVSSPIFFITWPHWRDFLITRYVPFFAIADRVSQFWLSQGLASVRLNQNTGIDNVCSHSNKLGKLTLCRSRVVLKYFTRLTGLSRFLPWYTSRHKY